MEQQLSKRKNVIEERGVGKRGNHKIFFANLFRTEGKIHRTGETKSVIFVILLLKQYNLRYS